MTKLGSISVNLNNVMTHNDLMEQPSIQSRPPAALTRWTGFLLAWVAAAGGGFYTRALADIGLKPQHVGVLVLLRDGPSVQARLSERLGVFKPAMVALVNQLEAQDLVRRHPHPRDRRAVEVRITAAGAERLGQAEIVSGAASKQFFAALTAEEQQTFHELLVKLAHPLPDRAASPVAEETDEP